jgi:hypothetical protein
MRAVLLFGICVFGAAPRPKTTDDAVPLTEEQFLEILGEKKEISWTRGSAEFVFRVKEVKGKDLIGVEVIRKVDGKAQITLTSRRSWVHPIDGDSHRWRFVFDEGTIKEADREMEFRDQSFDAPAPTRAKK